MRFMRFTFSLKSPLFGVHMGQNPVSGQRFMHVAPVPFFGIDFQLPPYVQDQAKRLMRLRDLTPDMIEHGAEVLRDMEWMSSCSAGRTNADDQSIEWARQRVESVVKAIIEDYS